MGIALVESSQELSIFNPDRAWEHERGNFVHWILQIYPYFDSAFYHKNPLGRSNSSFQLPKIKHLTRILLQIAHELRLESNGQ